MSAFTKDRIMKKILAHIEIISTALFAQIPNSFAWDSYADCGLSGQGSFLGYNLQSTEMYATIKADENIQNMISILFMKDSNRSGSAVILAAHNFKSGEDLTKTPIVFNDKSKLTIERIPYDGGKGSFRLMGTYTAKDGQVTRVQFACGWH